MLWNILWRWELITTAVSGVTVCMHYNHTPWPICDNDQTRGKLCFEPRRLFSSPGRSFSASVFSKKIPFICSGSFIASLSCWQGQPQKSESPFMCLLCQAHDFLIDWEIAPPKKSKFSSKWLWVRARDQSEFGKWSGSDHVHQPTSIASPHKQKKKKTFPEVNCSMCTRGAKWPFPVIDCQQKKHEKNLGAQCKKKK